MRTIKLFVNADDFGLNTECNKGVLYSFSMGYIDKVSLIVNTNASDEAVLLSKRHNFTDKVGLHLNLTEGVPLTDAIKKTSFCDSEGYFIPYNPRSKKRVFSFKNINSIRCEIEAQIKKFMSYGYALNFVDFHNDIFFNLPVWLALRPLLNKYNFQYIRGVEPYLFGRYRKSILSYLPLKYHFLLCYYCCKSIGTTKIMRGGRNINQYVLDYNGYNPQAAGCLSQSNPCVEVITHPEMIGDICIDRTNFDSNRKRYSMDNSIEKLNSTQCYRVDVAQFIN